MQSVPSTVRFMIIDKVDSCEPLYSQVYRHTCSVDRVMWPFNDKHSVCTTCYTANQEQTRCRLTMWISAAQKFILFGKFSRWTENDRLKYRSL